MSDGASLASLMRHRMGRRGVAGFLEEVPAAWIVITALFLFFAALFSGLNSFERRQQNVTFAEQAPLLLSDLRDYKNLTYQGEVGVFDVFKVLNLKTSNISYDFHPSFQYRVVITDISSYPHAWLTQPKVVETAVPPTNPSGLKQGFVTSVSPVDIWFPGVPYGEYHTATLSVEIWN